MNEILFLECSPYGCSSVGAAQILKALGDLEIRNREIHVTTRSLSAESLAPVSAQYAQAITSSAPLDSTAFDMSERLIRELECCDGLVISTPMHNFAVPASLKLWIDHVLRKDRSFTITEEGKIGLLRDRPTLVLVRSGGPCVGDSARQPDFLTPYLRYVLSALGIHDVRFDYLPGLTPSADELAQARNAVASFLSLPTSPDHP